MSLHNNKKSKLLTIKIQKCLKGKKAEHLYSALHGIQTTLKRSGMDHTVLLAINTMPALPRKRSPDGELKYWLVHGKVIDAFWSLTSLDADWCCRGQEDYISFEEAVAILRQELKYPEDRALHFVKRFDHNNDGRLSAVEFGQFRNKVEEA